MKEVACLEFWRINSLEKSCERSRDIIIGKLVCFAAAIIGVFNIWRWSHFNLKWPLISLEKTSVGKPLSEKRPVYLGIA